MADQRKNGKPWRKKRRLKPGRFDRFVAERTEPAGNDRLDWTSEETLWAHYCRWTFLGELQRSTRPRLFGWLNKQGVGHEPCNGATIWALRLVDPAERQSHYEDKDKARRKVVKGHVRVTRPLTFIKDGAHVEMPVGIELQWMAPSRREQEDIKELYERQVKNKSRNPIPTLVVIWENKRRLIPADAIEMID